MDLSNEPRKLELLKNSHLMSTELVGVHDEDMRWVGELLTSKEGGSLRGWVARGGIDCTDHPRTSTPKTEHSSFSYAYKFVTNQGTFIAFRWDVFTSGKAHAMTLGTHRKTEDRHRPRTPPPPTDDIPQPEGFSGDWAGSKDYKKAWEQRVKDELLATRKDMIKTTLAHFRKVIAGGADPKDALKVCVCMWTVDCRPMHRAVV